MLYYASNKLLATRINHDRYMFTTFAKVQSYLIGRLGVRITFVFILTNNKYSRSNRSAVSALYQKIFGFCYIYFVQS